MAALPSVDAASRGVTTAVLAEAQRRDTECEMPPGTDRESLTGASSSAGPATSVGTPSSTEVEQIVRIFVAGEQVNQRSADITTETVMLAAGLNNASEQVRLAVEAEVVRVSRPSVAAIPELHPVMPEVLVSW